MEIDPDAIAEQMRTTVPKCLAQLVATPTDRPEAWDGDVVAVWRVACRCGGQHGAFLGHLLSGVDPEYSGRDLIGPLGFECASCRQVAEVLDTDRHGYHADACGSPLHTCGAGPPDAFVCPACDGQMFEVITSFFYWPAALDLVEDEPAEFAARAQDLFCEFVAHGRCQKCHTVTRMAEFGKL